MWPLRLNQQTTALYPDYDLRWPDELFSILRGLSAFNFNVDLLAPACVVAVGFYSRYAFKVVRRSHSKKQRVGLQHPCF